jgi:hypothetical protein
MIDIIWLPFISNIYLPLSASAYKMTNNNVSTNSITTNADANPDTATPEPTMSEAIKKLEQRIA